MKSVTIVKYDNGDYGLLTLEQIISTLSCRLKVIVVKMFETS
jgi:hypothetical protein